MSDTKKHRDFVKEPMGGKSVNCLPGIGSYAADNLKENKYTTARQVLGEFLRLKGDQKEFCSWLMEKSGALTKSQHDCFMALKVYSDNFV